ncbi:MAG TPA: SpoIIE family protein phosphatase [Melioribacteraceae bacterium]|nr:SpoIIE family protein phosphatase [Melioribacteraceae bacterium]
MQTTDHNATLRNFSALVDFSNLVNSSLDLNFALNNILLTCFGKFHTSKGLIALFNEDGILEIKSQKGLLKTITEKFPSVSQGEINTNQELKNFIEMNGFPICQEIKSSEGVKGILLLGNRLTNRNYDSEDVDFLKTILNVGATAIENSLTVEKLKKVNRDLDGKINQLYSLFDLGKEFSGILQVENIARLLVYSLIGQMLVSKYSIITCIDGTFSILENRFDESRLAKALKDCNAGRFSGPLNRSDMKGDLQVFAELGVDLIVPMQIKNTTKGLIILGKRKNDLAYTKSDIEFVSSLGSLAIISIENARLFTEALEKQRLEKDLETARNIQKNLLPKKFPVFSSLEIDAYNASAKMVGGDYYDVVKLDNNRVLVAIADVSGKGVPAALLMANVQAFLKSICKQNLPLAEATNLMNDLVAENTTMGSFITFFWALFENDTRKLTYVNAGHNPPLHVYNGRINKFKKGGMILGVLPTTIPYVSETIQLESGQAVVLFTDGITEAMNKNGEEFTDEKLEKIVSGIYNESPKYILDKIKAQVEEFTAGAEQSDDITCLVLKVK